MRVIVIKKLSQLPSICFICSDLKDCNLKLLQTFCFTLKLSSKGTSVDGKRRRLLSVQLLEGSAVREGGPRRRCLLVGMVA